VAFLLRNTRNYTLNIDTFRQVQPGGTVTVASITAPQDPKIAAAISAGNLVVVDSNAPAVDVRRVEYSDVAREPDGDLVASDGSPVSSGSVGLDDIEGLQLALDEVNEDIAGLNADITATAVFHTAVEARVDGRVNVYVTTTDPSAQMGEGDVWIGP
jgi:hypothetical protein